jgi:hypothetical protein
MYIMKPPAQDDSSDGKEGDNPLSLGGIKVTTVLSQETISRGHEESLSMRHLVLPAE